MKILVIGNGFDLDHNLPTGYYEFIKFCDNIVRFKSNRNLGLINLTPIQETYFEILKDNYDLLDNFNSLLEKNNLYKYFSNISITNKWIDMEAEILSILTELDNLETLMSKRSNTVRISYGDKQYKKIISLFYNGKEITIGEINITTNRTNLFNWLNEISIALEMYISNFINETPIEFYSPDILDFDADKIITFNYSNIYEKIYSSAKSYSYCNYIHGKASTNIENKNSHIVLGITDPLIEHDKRAINSKFEKYFQRITKKTSNEYKGWLNGAEDIELAFFGHSLFSSDGDIIQELINRADKTTIFYYDLKMYQDTVMHLVEIIGKEKLIDYVYSRVPKIEFKQQKNHIDIANSGLEISKDIIRIRSLYTETESSINSFLDKIENKIDFEKTDYFHSQKLLIDLYYELICNNINITDSRYLSKIAYQLEFSRSSSGAIEYNIDDYNFDENIFKGKKLDFSTLINLINENNNARFSKNHYNYYIEEYSNNIEIIDIIKKELLNLKTDNQWDDFVDFLINIDQNIYITLKYLKQKSLSNAERIKLTHLIKQYEKKYINYNDDFIKKPL